MISDLKRFALLVVAALIVAVSLSSFMAGRYTSTRIPALIDTVRIADSTEKPQRDTLYIYRAATVKATAKSDSAKAKSDALDSAVVIANDSTVIVPDSTQTGTQPAVIPAIVVADLLALRGTVAHQDATIRQQAAEITRLWQHDTTQEWRIASRDKLIRELSTRHPFACGRKCGLALGFTAGILLHKAAK